MGLLGAVRGCDVFLEIPVSSGKPARFYIAGDYTIEPLGVLPLGSSAQTAAKGVQEKLPAVGRGQLLVCF